MFSMKSDDWDSKERIWDKTSEGDESPKNSQVNYWVRNHTLERYVDPENPHPIDFLGAMKEIEKLRPIFRKHNSDMIVFNSETRSEELIILNVNSKWYIATAEVENVFESSSRLVSTLSDKQVSSIIRLWFEGEVWFDFVDEWKIWRADTDEFWSENGLLKIYSENQK